MLTAHDVLPREPRPGQLAAQRRLYERMDAVVVHSEHGRRRLVEELGLASERVHVIPHGVLRPWEGLHDGALSGRRGSPGDRGALPPEFGEAAGPVVLFFGLLRPYKGIDVLLEAWRATASGEHRSGLAGAELWIVGMPRMELGPCTRRHWPRERAGAGRVRLLPRFVSDAETGAFMRRASLVVLPYREIDQSGVLFTALGAGRPLLLSDAGGFPEVAATGAARTVPAGDVAALAAALAELLVAMTPPSERWRRTRRRPRRACTRGRRARGRTGALRSPARMRLAKARWEQVSRDPAGADRQVL